MNNYYTRWICLGILLLICTITNGQIADCECEDASITICYLSDDEYCYSDAPNNPCGYTLDGSHMSSYLRQKLLNRENFGLNGVAPCPIDMKVIEGNITLPYIQNQQCDIIFVGNFGTDTLTFATDLEVTALPDNVLSSIRDWSMLCPTNLVITTQAEAKMWGYTIENENENPNIASSVDNDLNIFDGPFGEVPTFSQGGTYQGVITEGPSTGYTELAVDNLGRPTAVIDSRTNDLIFGDIGIFCGGGAGSISFGDEVNNRNDKFTCNIFALVCSIAGVQNTQTDIALCPGEDYALPSGEFVSDSGTYIDTLTASNFCDSIIITNLSYLDSSSNTLTYNGCEGDGYEVTVGGVIYNENNQNGNETLVASAGCDSIVFVELSFAETTGFFFQETICDGDNSEFLIGTELFNKDRLFGSVLLENAQGCDSIVDVDIILESSFIETEEYQKCKDEPLTIRNRTYSEAMKDTFYYTKNTGCDSIYVVNINNYESISSTLIRDSINLYVNEDYTLYVPIDDTYTIQWEPSDLVSCSDCSTTTLFSDGSIDVLTYTITDENLCSQTFDINLFYLCNVYIPNAISLRDQSSVNASFRPFKSNSCDISDDYGMYIYDRWGELVFFTDDPEVSWNGYYRNEPASLGVYTYFISYEINGIRIKRSGDFTII